MRFRVWCPFNLVENVELDNLRPGRALRWKAEDRQLGWSESVKWQASTPKVVAPLLCRLRTDGLAPSKPNSMSSIGAWLKHTALMVVLGEKLRRVLQATQPGWEVESGALFLRSSTSVQPYWQLMKGCYVLTTWDTYDPGPYMDWAWNACGVLVGFPL
jgi:hypothetical protein